ncbi:MerR family DNA-binding transcriptional regulator [Ahrensia kielensis]|uniref:MerR family DNA-binding transcriptional regulator n=1 Tax=Ahrensia kielensis TaxID=76980 RepID=A0ABU9T2P6_9HYPH
MNGLERFDKNNPEETFRIGQLAEEFDVTLRTLRFYEDKKLLAPRRIGNTRIYSRGDRARLRIILLGKRLGFSLADVAEILALYDPESGNVRQLKVSLEKGEEQLTKLQLERDQIDASISELEKTIVSFRNMLTEAEKK